MQVPPSFLAKRAIHKVQNNQVSQVLYFSLSKKMEEIARSEVESPKQPGHHHRLLDGGGIRMPVLHHAASILNRPESLGICINYKKTQAAPMYTGLHLKLPSFQLVMLLGLPHQIDLRICRREIWSVASFGQRENERLDSRENLLFFLVSDIYCRPAHSLASAFIQHSWWRWFMSSWVSLWVSSYAILIGVSLEIDLGLAIFTHRINWGFFNTFVLKIQRSLQL